MSSEITALFPAIEAYLHGKPTRSVDLALLRELLTQLEDERRKDFQMSKIAPAIVEQVEKYLDRISLLRRFLPQEVLDPGQETKVTLAHTDSVTFSLESDSTPISFIKQREVYLREVYTSTELSFELKNLNRLNLNFFTDYLDMAKEDLCTKESKLLTSLLSALPSVEVSEITESWLLGITRGREGKILISDTLWNDFCESIELSKLFTAVRDHSSVLAGHLGSLQLGDVQVGIYTDGMLHQSARIPENTLVFFAEGCGRTLVRRTTTAEPLNKTIVGIPSKGWFICEIHAPVILNMGKVVVAKKV